MNDSVLPIGKLPAKVLERLISKSPVNDPRVVIGPGIGLDCAVIQAGSGLMVFKSDPITFATDEIGWYAVQINANDIATTGAVPHWFLVTLLLPQGKATAGLAETIIDQVQRACREIGVAVIGGHTEITSGLDHPIVVGTMIGEVAPDRLVTPRGAQPGDRLLLTKGIPIEATALIAREFASKLQGILTPGQLDEARAWLHHPGISVLRDAQVAVRYGHVTAMHDPTEGGLATALWELAQASGCSLIIDRSAVPVPELAAIICRRLGLDPFGAIASGALLLASPAGDAQAIRQALMDEGIPCAEIGRVEAGPVAVWLEKPVGREELSHPQRDEIAKLYE